MDPYSVQHACVGGLSRLFECADQLDHIVHTLPHRARRDFGEALLTVLCRPPGAPESNKRAFTATDESATHSNAADALFHLLSDEGGDKEIQRMIVKGENAARFVTMASCRARRARAAVRPSRLSW